MNIVATVTYCVNDGADQTARIALSMPEGFVNDDFGRLDVMSKAADTLVGKGHIMVSNVEVTVAEDAPA